jgi:hypothetical protein
VLFGKLALARWWEWPANEQAAIQDYLMAFWRRLLATYPCSIPGGIGLSALGMAVADLAPFLAVWRGDERLPSALHLATFVRSECAVISGAPLRNVWWVERPHHAAHVATWLRNPRTRDTLERAFFTCADAPFAVELSWAVDCFPIYDAGAAQ